MATALTKTTLWALCLAIVAVGGGAAPASDASGARSSGRGLFGTQRAPVASTRCAAACRATYLVTGDRELLALHPHEGTETVTPADLVRRLTAPP